MRWRIVAEQAAAATAAAIGQRVGLLLVAGALAFAGGPCLVAHARTLYGSLSNSQPVGWVVATIQGHR
jgi:hypothetical protein